MSADASAVVALLLVLGAVAPAAATQQGGVLPPPPVCVGPGRALQWDGAGWRCATIGGAGCTERTLCATGRCPTTAAGGYLIAGWSDSACGGGGDGKRCTYRICR
jgi:hypothetical protein